MEHAQIESEVARRSALIYLPISLSAGILFFLVTNLTDSYPPLAKIGGAVWVSLLSLIISMPIVTSRLKQHAGTTVEVHE